MAHAMRILAILPVLAAPFTAPGQTTIDTTPTADFIGPFSDTSLATWGQVFSSPVSGTLDTFSLSLQTTEAGEFSFFVAPWTGTRAGLPVYDSGILNSGLGVQQFDFSPTLPVSAGSEYVAFVNNSAFRFTGNSLNSSIGYSASDYLGGSLFFQDSGSDFSQTMNADWFDSGLDASFHASFTAVPESEHTGIIAGVTLLGISIFCRRRVKAQAE